MRIKVLTRACGRLNFRPGQVIELPENDCRALLKAGAAELLAPAPVPLTEKIPMVSPQVAESETPPAPERKRPRR